MHYDPSCEWVAHLPEAPEGKKDNGGAPAVIYLSPAKAQGGRGAGQEPRPLGCAPLGPHGAVVCDEGIRLWDDDAALVVVTSGEQRLR